MDLKSYFRGALLGTGIGDSIGRSREGRGKIGLEKVKKVPKKQDMLRYTDDTQQMMALAESLAESEGFDGQNFAEKLVEYFDPSRGYGPGSTQVIRALESGEEWDKPARRSFEGEGSYGNGSSMRIAPVGLFAFDDLGNLSNLARESSKVTHTHRLGVDGAVLQAASVGIAAGKDPREEMDRSSFLEKLRNLVNEEEYLEKIRKIEHLLDGDPDRKEVVRELGNGFKAFSSVPTAVYCFLSRSDSFVGSVAFAISLGGDADTIGAMTGAISGAFRGKTDIPDSWIEKLEDLQKIINLADRLLEARS